jgi:hypothetical protein
LGPRQQALGEFHSFCQLSEFRPKRLDLFGHLFGQAVAAHIGLLRASVRDQSTSSIAE